MVKKTIIYISIYILAVIVGGITAGMLSVPFIYQTQTTVVNHSIFLGAITLVYSVLILPIMIAFHMLVRWFLPTLFLFKWYPVFAYIIFGANHFIAGFTFFSRNYWPIKLPQLILEHLIVLAMAAALSGSTAIYANVGLEKIKNHYQKDDLQY